VRQQAGFGDEKEKDSLKVNEQYGNVIENKALHFLEGVSSGNVTDIK
jgi:hypothetical protein